MKTISFFKHSKEITDFIYEVELIQDNKEWIVRVKYESMETSTFYSFDNPTRARYEFTKFCLFILS